LVLPYKYEDGKYNDKFLIYFHGNAEDIGYAYDFANEIRIDLKLNIILMEYPGYGIYKNLEPSADQIANDARQLITFILKNTKINLENVILFGRSMGSGKQKSKLR
jgi:abhydrolase domain-containing protein 17